MKSSLINTNHRLIIILFIYAWTSAGASSQVKQGAIRASKKVEVTVIRFSPIGDTVALGCKDNLIHVLSATSGYRHVALCRGHSSYIRNIDFSTDGLTIRSTDAAKELLHWDVMTGQRVTNPSNFRDLEWVTHSSVYHWAAQGIYNRWNGNNFGAPDSEINCAARTPDGRYLVAGGSHTGHSALKLFNFPCLPNCIPSLHGGHTSPVLDLSFITLNSKAYQLISVGGNDSCIFQWKFKKI